MPIGRFFGYIDYMNKYHREQNKTPQEVKVDRLRSTMSKEDRIKYEEEYG